MKGITQNKIMATDSTTCLFCEIITKVASTIDIYCLIVFIPKERGPFCKCYNEGQISEKVGQVAASKVAV